MTVEIKTQTLLGNRTFERLRHLTTTIRIHHVVAFWCKLEFLLFKPRGDC